MAGVTAGGVNYFSRAAQIENAKNEYIKGLGIPPGPPTMKGIYAQPEYTGKGFPDGGTPVQDPPRGWPRKPVFNPPGGPPGPPIQWGDELTNETVEPGFGYIGTGAIPENDQYFYHPDHLGSTAYVTNVTGAVCQFFVYLPYGETLIDKHSSPWKVPYTFSAKEQDAETKLTYFEARYYDAKYTTFLSVDPMWMKYPGISAYAYCANNPVRFIDPDGRDWYEIVGKDGNGIGKYEWYKGSDERDGYRNLGSVMSFRTGNLTETYDQLDLISIEEHLLDKGDFVSQLGAGGKNKPGYNCFVASKEMLSKKGITALDNRSNGIEVGVESGTATSHVVTATKDAQAGINYLNSQIDNGNAVVVGVDYVHGRGINGGTTDHYIAISSRIIDVRTGAMSYRYFDPGRSTSSAGTQSQNIFTINNNLLQGQGYIRSNPWYIVTHVRKNQ